MGRQKTLSVSLDDVEGANTADDALRMLRTQVRDYRNGAHIRRATAEEFATLRERHRLEPDFSAESGTVG